jgi:hypothetical protein
MPRISFFFGIAVWMYYDEHSPPHLHAEFQGNWAVLDFQGNVLRGGLGSRTALRLAREWIDLRAAQLGQDWELALSGQKLMNIEPLT